MGSLATKLTLLHHNAHRPYTQFHPPNTQTSKQTIDSDTNLVGANSNSPKPFVQGDHQ